MGKWGRKNRSKNSGTVIEPTVPVDATAVGSQSPKPKAKRKRWVWVGVILVVIAALLAGGVWTYQHFRGNKSGQMELHSVDEAAYKPDAFETSLAAINKAFTDKKPQEAIDLAHSIDHDLGPEEQRALYSSMSAQCYVAAQYECAVEYYAKLSAEDLTLDKQLRYADAKEKTGDEQAALTMYQAIKADRSNTYAGYESAPDIDKQVDEAIARLQ